MVCLSQCLSDFTMSLPVYVEVSFSCSQIHIKAFLHIHLSKVSIVLFSALFLLMFFVRGCASRSQAAADERIISLVLCKFPSEVCQSCYSGNIRR